MKIGELRRSRRTEIILRRSVNRHDPPYGPLKLFLISCIFRQIWQICMLAPTSWRVGAPSYGESWIRPCVKQCSEYSIVIYRYRS